MLSVHRNDLENVALFLLTLFSLFLVSSKAEKWIMPLFIAVFVASRVAHTVLYSLALRGRYRRAFARARSLARLTLH